MDTVGERIRRQRQRLGLDQAELAGLVGVSARTVGSWERGETQPDRFTGKLEDKLGINLKDGSASSDPVHRAIQQSGLSAGRQHRVLSVYEDALAEQARESA